MAPLNPYFLQGSASEQRLVQDLINEQLRMYGQDIVYMPRKYIGEKTVISENIHTKFDDSFRIEAYLSNFDGFGGQGDILSKFGVRSTDEITLIISKERYEDFITPFITVDSDIKLSTRPAEGDLIYFPLDNSLFEIKYVESKRPFYQLNNLYVYELRCELFEYEDELIDTSIPEVDTSVKDFGYTITLNMVRSDVRSASLDVPGIRTSKSVSSISIINPGYGYLTPPRIEISKPSSPSGIQARAVATMRLQQSGKSYSIDKVLITEPGSEYTTAPKITIISSSGSNAILEAVLSDNSLEPITIQDGGSGYLKAPQITISNSPAGNTAIATANLNSNGSIVSINYLDAGSGYLPAFSRSISVDSPVGISSGNYMFNEQVVGENSGTTAYVKRWNSMDRTLEVSIIDGSFVPGEEIVGTKTAARYELASSNNMDDFNDKYSENVEIESEADIILDFTEKNPFGEY